METQRIRMLRDRALGLITITGLLVTLAPAAAQAKPASTACRTVAVPVPAGTTTSSINGGDPTGHYLVGVAYHVGGTTGLLWHDGRITQIDASVLTPYVQADFNDVNRHGVVVGERMTDYNSFHTDAFIYQSGRFTLLPAPHPGDETHAVAINSHGDVVGNAFTATGWHPVLWPANRPGTVRVLTAGNAFATDIDENGTVVGYLEPYPDGTPYVWPVNGRPYALPVPPGGTGGVAVAIRLGMVAGNVLDPATGGSKPALWNLRTGDFTFLRDIQGSALSVNRWGTLGLTGMVVHSDGRVVPVGGWVNVITDHGLAAGSTNP